MAPGPIVEDLDPVEDRGCRLGAGLPFLRVQQLGLQSRPERFDHVVVEGVASCAQ